MTSLAFQIKIRKICFKLMANCECKTQWIYLPYPELNINLPYPESNMNAINDFPCDWYITYWFPYEITFVKDIPGVLWDWSQLSYNSVLVKQLTKFNFSRNSWCRITVPDFKNVEIEILKMLLLLKLYNYYDTTVANKMSGIEIILYDIRLAKQIMLF